MSVVEIIRTHFPDNQKQMLQLFLGISFFIHILFFVLGHFKVFSLNTSIVPEWAIETELVSEIDLGASSKTVLPNAKKSEKVAVPSNLLPQISKNFAVKEKKLREEGLAEGEVDESLALGKNQTDDADKSGISELDKAAATRLKKSEALKRLAMEKLRKQQKEKSREYRAHESDLLPKLKESLNKDVGVGGMFSGGLMAQAEAQRYAAYLKKVVKRNWSLPKTYQLHQSDVKSGLHVVINARGELVSVKISEGSGDGVFDQYCINAVKKSAPFNPPPKGKAGDVFQINCIP